MRWRAVSLTLLGYTKSTELLFLIVVPRRRLDDRHPDRRLCVCGQFYPTAIRSTGIGLASGIGRSGAILAPILIGALVALKLPLEQNFMAIGLAGLTGSDRGDVDQSPAFRVDTPLRRNEGGRAGPRRIRHSRYSRSG